MTIARLYYNVIVMFMESATKIKRESAPLRHQVQEVLREEILAGRLAPGQRLVEQQLCKALDVSRTVLREGIRQLDAEGLLEITPYRGAAVASVDLDEARQIYEVRGALEALSVRGFARHADHADLAALREVLAEMEIAAEGTPTGQEILAKKQRFYRVLLGGCGNDLVRQTISQVNNRISFLRAMSLARSGRLADTVREIRDIVEALENGDEEAAQAASLRHVESASIHALKTLRERLADAAQNDTGSAP